MAVLVIYGEIRRLVFCRVYKYIEDVKYNTGGHVKEFSVEVLAEEATKLLRLEVDDLYAALGGQILGQSLPTKVAGIVSYISALRTASEARSLYEALPSEPSLTQWGSGLEVIYEELRRTGRDLFAAVSDNLKKALCSEDILRLGDQVDRSAVQVVVMVVTATLRTPRELDPICATISAILFKVGLRNFCSQIKGAGRNPFGTNQDEKS